MSKNFNNTKKRNSTIPKLLIALFVSVLITIFVYIIGITSVGRELLTTIMLLLALGGAIYMFLLVKATDKKAKLIVNVITALIIVLVSFSLALNFLYGLELHEPMCIIVLSLVITEILFCRFLMERTE